MLAFNLQLFFAKSCAGQMFRKGFNELARASTKTGRLERSRHVSPKSSVLGMTLAKNAPETEPLPLTTVSCVLSQEWLFLEGNTSHYPPESY